MKNVLEIDVNSSIFAPMLSKLNDEIKRVVENIYENKFESGDITLKLSISFPEGVKKFPKEDEYGLGDTEFYYFRKPFFKHTVSTTLKQQYKKEGEYSEEREVKKIDDDYLLVPVEEPQISLFDEDFLD